MGVTAMEPELVFPVEKPAPVQEVALVLLQVRVEDCPEVMLVGLALRDAVGAEAVTVTLACAVALPPAPVHVMV